MTTWRGSAAGRNRIPGPESGTERPESGVTGDGPDNGFDSGQNKIANTGSGRKRDSPEIHLTRFFF